MAKSPKVIFLDWNKTLSYSRFWSQLANQNHPYNRYRGLITQWVFEKNIDLVNNWMRGKFTSEDVCKKIEEIAGIDSKIIFEALAESCANMELCSPEIPDLISRIKAKGIKTIIATDNMDTFRKFTIEGMGLDKIFDDFLVSYDLKLFKYDVDGDKIPFFDDFLKRNGLKYSEVILIDDSDDPTGVYKKVGFKIDLIKNPDELLDKLRIYAS